MVIRASAGAQLGNYQYSRKAAGNTSVNEWLQQRVIPVVAGHEVAVIDGTGRFPHGRTNMETLRASYSR